MEETNKPAGFWIRALALMLDGLLLVGAAQLLFQAFGMPFTADESVFRTVLGLIATAVFWAQLSSSPGKMLLKLKIVDATTGADISVRQSILRALSYILSGAVLNLGFFWIIWDKRKQGWHDKIANT